MLKQDLQGLSVPFEHRKHEKGQHDEDHQGSGHANAQRVLRQEKQGQTGERAKAEADHLALGA